MTDAVVESVLIRGPMAARFARIAATELPRALEATLAGLADARVGTIEVPLPPELAELDDATIAVVWARAVRAELDRRAPAVSVRSENADQTGPSGTQPAPSAWTLADALTQARAWLARTTPRGPLTRSALELPRWLERPLASPQGSPGQAFGEIESLAQLLDQAITHEASWTPPPDHVAEPSALPTGENPTKRAPASAGHDTTTKGEPVPHAAPLANPASAPAPEPRSATDAATHLTSLAELLGDATHLDPAATTRAAGLALLYPWLGDVCRAATALHPGRDQADVRAHALAAIVDPADPSLTADPFIRLLAGVDPNAPAVTMPLARAADAEEEADRALLSFVSLVPGFAQSSPAFVRREWVSRTGLLDREADPVRLVAASHPLDVVLARLPYPVSLFKLPWAPMVTVRFVP